MDYSILIWVAALIALVYFMMIRPNKKRFDEQQQILKSLTPGTRVMLTSGVFGTIRAIGDQQLVVELAPGVDVTVVKQVVAKVLDASEEEFEYDDAELEAETPNELGYTDPDPAALAAAEQLAWGAPQPDETVESPTDEVSTDESTNPAAEEKKATESDGSSDVTTL